MPNKKSFSFPSLATVGYKGDHIFSIFTLMGINSGMGCIHIEDVKILSFGPQTYPLGEMKNYGIFRPFYNKNSFDDVFSKKEDL